MDIIFPQKLNPGDEVRVISPSRSLSIISKETQEIANKRFAEMGLKLSFGKHVNEINDFNSSSIESRVSDFHDAFLDKNVKAVLTVVGGYSANQILDYIDWEIVRNNPKIFCGYSDITALNNSILSMSGLVNYSGVHYSTFGMEQFFDYSLSYFKKCLMNDDPYEIQPSDQWTDDPWFMNQNDRHPIKNEGWMVVNEGKANGHIRGGNLCTLNLLQGTKYMPDIKDSVLFIEDDAESLPHTFDRDLVSLIQQPDFNTVKAVVIGRFQNGSHMTNDLLLQIINTKKELKNIPIIANVDFGHTNSMITYPIGGYVEIDSNKKSPKINIIKH